MTEHKPEDWLSPYAQARTADLEAKIQEAADYIVRVGAKIPLGYEPVALLIASHQELRRQLTEAVEVRDAAIQAMNSNILERALHKAVQDGKAHVQRAERAEEELRQAVEERDALLDAQWQFWKPEDRFYHGADKTWWRFDPASNRLVRAEPPA